MCGLVGVIAFADTEDLDSSIRPLVAMIARRGPDDEGMWTDGRRCALGFRRLAILDLSPSGHQPMTTEDARYTLVFNGEIYNFREIRAELEALGHRPRSSGDAEVLLLALRQWGRDALRRLNGMFALGFYDAYERRLLLARDHAGIKPLYVAQTSKGVVFGSQYNQLLAHPWCRDAPVDAAGLGLYLRLGFLPTTHGLHRGVGQLQAGQWMQVDAFGLISTGQFFDLPKLSAPTLRGNSAIDALDDALARAVRRHLESDVSVGVLLSGGIDSPLIAAEARRQHGATMPAFTIGVDVPVHDETDDARRYADEIGLTHIVEQISSSDALALLDDVVAASTEPTADYSMFPTLMVSRLARRNVKVVLSGDGGDELFWGYPDRFGSAIAQAPYFGWPRPARYAAIAARRWLRRGAATRDILNFDSLGRLYQRKHTLTAEADLSGIFPTLPGVPPEFRMFQFEGTDPEEAAQWVRWNEFHIHLSRVLAKVDRASMFHSLEVRVPLLDKEVIDVAWRTDWRSCLDLPSRRGKIPLRAVLARRVRHQTTAKKGFTVPMQAWLTGPLRPLVNDLLLEREELLGLPIQRRAIAHLEAKLRAGDGSKAWGLWLLLSLALWERAHARPAR